MRELPAYYDDPVLSCWGTMLFPNDAARAEAYVAVRLFRATAGRPGILTEYREAGHDWSGDRRRRQERMAGQNDFCDDDVDSAAYAGSHVGELVKLLWAMICEDTDNGGISASWKRAIAEVDAHPSTVNTAHSTATDRLAEFSPVLHLWGAHAFRRQYQGRDFCAFKDLSDFRQFVGEAGCLLHVLRKWAEELPHWRRNGMAMLGADEYGHRTPVPWVALPHLTLSKSA